MPPANLQIYADAATIAADATLVDLLDREFDIEIDLSDTTCPFRYNTGGGWGMNNTVSVDASGAPDFYFYEDTSGAKAVHNGELQARLRELGIAYQWAHQMYVGDEDYEYETHQWQPGMTAERVTGENTGIPADFYATHRHLPDAELGAALRAAAEFRFEPPVITAS